MTTSTTPDFRSRPLREFARRFASGDAGAQAALVADLEAAGGPLVEPLDEDTLLVTFVYIGDFEAVAVDSHLIMDDVGERPGMERIPGTDVWFLSIAVDDDRIVVSYRFLINSSTSLLSLTEIEQHTQTEADHRLFAADRHLSSRHDPHNPDRIKLDGRQSFAHDPEVLALVDDPEELVRWESVLTLPGADPRVDVAGLLAGDPGRLETHTLPAGVFGDEREITVYTPSDAEPHVRHSLLLVLDGPGAISMGLPEMLTSLSERGLIRPTIAAFVHNKNSWSRSEEMVCNPELATQYSEEILPWLRENYPVTDNPARTVVGGGSYGGLGSAWLAFCRPDLFGNVLSMSGSHWWGMRTAFGADKDSGVYGFDDEPEWLGRQFAARPRKAVRFWIGIGTLERQHLPGGLTLLSANRNFRSVLQAREYDVCYRELHGGHDRASWRQAFVEGLIHLIGPN